MYIFYDARSVYLSLVFVYQGPVVVLYSSGVVVDHFPRVAKSVTKLL